MSQELSQQRIDFANLLSAHRSQIYGYILALVHNTADAEDLFQQTSMILWKKFSQYDVEKNFSQWGCKIAQFEVLNFIRKKRRSQVYFNDELVAELADIQTSKSEETEEDFQSALNSCLQKLPEKDRILVEGCYADSFSIKHAAEKIGRPVDSVYKSLNRIRLALMNCITRVLNTRGTKP